MDRFVGYARLQEQLPSAYLLRLTVRTAYPTKLECGIRNNKPLLSFIKVNLLPQTAWLIPNSGFEYERQLRLTGVDLNLKSIDTILRDADPLNALMPFAKCIV
jgi:hypothetical protein